MTDKSKGKLTAAMQREMRNTARELERLGYAVEAQKVRSLMETLRVHPEDDDAYEALIATWTARLVAFNRQMGGDVFDLLTIGATLCIALIRHAVTVEGLDTEAAIGATEKVLRSMVNEQVGTA